MAQNKLSYELIFWFILIVNSGKQKSKKFLKSRNHNSWLSYPTHFLESRGSVIRSNFLEYRIKQATLFVRGNDFMHCSLQLKQTYTQ